MHLHSEQIHSIIVGHFASQQLVQGSEGLLDELRVESEQLLMLNATAGIKQLTEFDDWPINHSIIPALYIRNYTDKKTSIA